MQISPSVRAVQVPDENPMHPVFTSIYLVGKDGGGEALTIDSGEAVDRYRWMLRGYLAATERAEIALAGITHFHLDHSGNLKWMREALKAEVLVADEAKPFLEKDERLPEDGLRPLRPGQVIDLDGGVRVQTIFTPGHSPDSLCYYIEDEGVLFTGDTLLGSSTTTVHDLAAYRRSLKRLRELPKLEVILPGHGEVVRDPRERLQMYIDHRDQRERQILAVLAEGGVMTSWDIMLKIYGDINPRLRRAADGNVQAHLRQLEQEGRLNAYAGVPKEKAPPTPEEVAEHERRENIKKEAEKIEKEERAAAIAAQENPPDDEWIERPRYELIGTPRE
ncbi:MAG TPA: MBL fold metallo-hydrolase [Dehalococcoidia bacterium]|jgi:ribonuclease/clavin/mitogillin|nr:MBL fold metallo-hydrolase [Dehalococcoidia bacterium]